MVVTFLTYTAVLLRLYDAAKPAHRETDEAHLDSSTVWRESNPAKAAC